MISLNSEDGTPIWVSPMHVTSILPVSEDATKVTLVCGTVVTVSGNARQIAASVAADTVMSPEGAAHAVHPLEMK